MKKAVQKDLIENQVVEQCRLLLTDASDRPVTVEKSLLEEIEASNEGAVGSFGELRGSCNKVKPRY